MPSAQPQPDSQPASKACARCGRTIEWRKKWARDWDNVRFCSDSCRHHKLSPVDHALEAAILDLLKTRGRDKTICPSEAARGVASAGATPAVAWHDLMEPARAAARRLQVRGVLVITQGGHPVDPSHARGPIRLKLL